LYFVFSFFFFFVFILSSAFYLSVCFFTLKKYNNLNMQLFNNPKL
ncbi:hypothetical protein KSS87_018144, partial [Heliosperma pusillum]